MLLGTFTGTAFNQYGTVLRDIRSTALDDVLASAQTTNGQTYGLSYGYNLAHGMTQMRYPTGRAVRWNYDAGNRVAGVGGTAVARLEKGLEQRLGSGVRLSCY